MTNLQNLLIEKLCSGLKRASVKTPSQWACQYRVMGGDHPGKWSFKYHPWLKEMHDSKSEYNVGMKCAQVGFSETMLNLAFFTIDVLARDCLYVLPSKTPDASDFSSGRFDAALELSPHLANLFQDTKNIGHKRAGSANFYIRGSQSKSGLKSLPISTLIMDEVEEFVQEHIPLALERLSGQFRKLAWMVSTPCLPNKGIDKYFRLSTQEEFFFKCPSCSRFINLTFPDSIVITAEIDTDPALKDTHLICKECKAVLHHETKHEWLTSGIYVPAIEAKRDWRGFSINQMYSTTIEPWRFATSFLRGRFNPSDETEFFNSKLGKTHTVEGAQLTDANVSDALENRRMIEPHNGGIITMGIDVGKWIHYEIDQWTVVPSTDAHASSRVRVLKMGKVKHFEELDDIVRNNYVISIVIDAHPERRKAFEFCMRFYGLARACIYAQGINGKMIKVMTDTADPIIHVDRTSWLDLSLGRFKNQSIRLPADTPLEYKEHMKSLIRVYKKDAQGNPIGSYETDDLVEDHYAHARNYAEIAFGFAINLGVVKDVTAP